MNYDNAISTNKILRIRLCANFFPGSGSVNNNKFDWNSTYNSVMNLQHIADEDEFNLCVEFNWVIRRTSVK